MKNMKKSARPRRLRCAATAVCLFFLVVRPAFTLALDTIEARYSEPRGQHIMWEIAIPDPAPEAVIVTQYIPAGTVIIESSHPVGSHDEKIGVAKWLLSGMQPGILKMEMKIDKPIRRKGEIRGEILFKDDNNNTIASVFMKPKARVRKMEGC